MGARACEISLRVFNAISRELDILTTKLWRFFEDFRPLSKDFQRFSKNCLKATRMFPENFRFRRLPKIFEDNRTLPKTFAEDPKMFR